MNHCHHHHFLLSALFSLPLATHKLWVAIISLAFPSFASYETSGTLIAEEAGVENCCSCRYAWKKSIPTVKYSSDACHVNFFSPFLFSPLVTTIKHFGHWVCPTSTLTRLKSSHKYHMAKWLVFRLSLFLLSPVSLILCLACVLTAFTLFNGCHTRARRERKRKRNAYTLTSVNSETGKTVVLSIELVFFSFALSLSLSQNRNVTAEWGRVRERLNCLKPYEVRGEREDERQGRQAGREEGMKDEWIILPLVSRHFS